MRAVNSDTEIPNLPPVNKSPAMKGNGVGSFKKIKELVVDPTGWREAFDAWLDAKVPAAKTMSAEKPLRIRQRLALSNWNREAHTPAFASSFPRLFRFHENTRRLAAATLWSMEKRMKIAMVSDAVLFPELTMAGSDSTSASLDADADDDADKSSIVTSLGANRVPSKAFMGAHLRVAEDAAKVHWPGYDAQAPFYLDEAQSRNLSIVYLATGSEEHRTMFHADAAARGIQVATKEDLLDATELAELRSLTWDQQAIIDFEVLVHSSYFAGFVRSSFSWVVAIRRSILPEAGKAVITKRDSQESQTTAVMAVRREGHARREAKAAPKPAQEPVVEKYRDGLSVVIGRYDAMTIMGIWP